MDSRREAGLSRRWFWEIRPICLALGLALAGAGFGDGGAAAEPKAVQTAADTPIAFDIPAQALAPAVEAYSVASGWQVLYEANLATGRQSAPVGGLFAPSVALRMLLAETGLVAEYMARDGVMLVPDPMARQGRLAPASEVRDYYGRIQAGLKRVFCADGLIRSGGYRIAIGFWIGASGAVTRVASLGSTGRVDVDAAFDRAVRRLSLDQPPRAGFEQPVVILVTPDLLRQCGAEPVRSAGAAR